MDIQTHSRTQQIKRLSRHLFIALTGFRYLLYMGWPAIVFVAFWPGGTFYLGDARITIDSTNLPLKWLILVLYAGGLFIMLKINYHFLGLMKQYMEGNIFGQNAIASVRGALKGGIAFVVLSSILKLLGIFYNYSVHSIVDFSIASEVIIACIYFGSMYTLLWALEIGSDLNDESEMTI